MKMEENYFVKTQHGCERRPLMYGPPPPDENTHINREEKQPDVYGPPPHVDDRRRKDVLRPNGYDSPSITGRKRLYLWLFIILLVLILGSVLWLCL